MFDSWNIGEAWFLVGLQNTIRNPFFDVLFNLVTFLGEKGWFFILTAVVFFIIPKTRKGGTVLCLSCAIDGIIVNLLLKNICERVRPFNLEIFHGILFPAAWDLPDSFSFPSGHTAIAFCVAVAALLTLPKKFSIPLTVLAVLTAFSRLYLGVHYPTDVLFGILAAALSAVIAYFIPKLLPDKFKSSCNRVLPNMF